MCWKKGSRPAIACVKIKCANTQHPCIFTGNLHTRQCNGGENPNYLIFNPHERTLIAKSYSCAGEQSFPLLLCNLNGADDCVNEDLQTCGQCAYVFCIPCLTGMSLQYDPDGDDVTLLLVSQTEYSGSILALCGMFGSAEHYQRHAHVLARERPLRACCTAATGGTGRRTWSAGSRRASSCGPRAAATD